MISCWYLYLFCGKPHKNGSFLQTFGKRNYFWEDRKSVQNYIAFLKWLLAVINSYQISRNITEKLWPFKGKTNKPGIWHSTSTVVTCCTVSIYTILYYCRLYTSGIWNQMPKRSKKTGIELHTSSTGILRLFLNIFLFNLHLLYKLKIHQIHAT